MLLLSSTPLVTNPVPIFFIVLVIILLAPVLLNRLKMPHIIGMIVAGVIVGPYGLNVLARDSSFEIFGQVGILYLMFLAGLEIDMFHLKKNFRTGMGFGLYTFFVPMAIGTVSSYYLLGLDWLTSVLMASMYASHTLVAYPIVSRFGLSKSPVVVITIAGTIVTVVGALLVLAGVVSIYREGAFQHGMMLRLLGATIVYIIGVIYAYPRLTRWFFKKYSDNVVQFIYVLALVLLAAWVSQIIGLESVLGAFLAGLVLNRYIPSVSPLMSRIEFVGNAIFIPYFLIGVGMLINIGVVVKSWETVYVAAVMSIVATACKWVAAWLTQHTYGMTKVERSLMFGLSNAQAAATLAAVMIGYNIGIFGEEVLNGTIVMILVTCTISSIVTERAAAKMKTEVIEREGDNQATDPRHYATLIPVANPVTVDSLVDLAVMMRRPQSTAPLYALHVRNDNTSSSRAIGRIALEKARKAAAAVDAKLVPIERYDINTVAGVVNTINERDITEIIIGMHRRSKIIDSFIGSTVEQMIKSTNHMVILSRCYIPLNTVTRIVVYVPPKAEYETGFARWVRAVGNLARQIRCRVIFCCSTTQRRYIKGVLIQGRYEIRGEYRIIDDPDDFVMLTNRVLDDDLLVVVSARATSLSYSDTVAEMPTFVQRYFSRNNVLMIYPEQFGAESTIPSFVDPMASDLTASVSPLWLRARITWRRLVALKKRITHQLRHRRK